jgi:SET domain-containing protein
VPVKSSTRRLFRIGRSRTGLGLFAIAAIPKGRFIVNYSGRRLPNDVADELDNKYLFELNSRWTIDGSGRRNLGRYANHSCRPNSEVYFVGHKIKIRSIKKIPEGAEITYNYGKDYFDSFIRPVGCKCEHCRKKRRRKRS